MKITSIAPVATTHARPVADEPARTASAAPAKTPTRSAAAATPAVDRLPWEPLDRAIDVRVRAQSGARGDAAEADAGEAGAGGRVEHEHDGEAHGAHGARGHARSGLAHLRNELRSALRDILGEDADQGAVHDAVRQFGDDLRAAFRTFKTADDAEGAKQALVDDVRAAFATLLTKLGDAIEADEGDGAGTGTTDPGDGASVEPAPVDATPADAAPAEAAPAGTAPPAAATDAATSVGPAPADAPPAAPAPAPAEDARLSALRDLFEKLVAGLEQRLHLAEAAPATEPTGGGASGATTDAVGGVTQEQARASYEFSLTA